MVIDVNLSEEEQVDALKKWWKENGRAVIAGVVIGLGAVFGWKMWNDHQKNIAEQASYQFAQLSRSTVASADESAAKQAEALIREYDGTTYAVFAAFSLARIKLQQGDIDGSRDQLQWVLDNSSDDNLQQIARLRLARLMIAANAFDKAATLISQAGNSSFKAEFDELAGDIALAKDDITGARTAYQRALDNGVSNSALVQMKLDDLARISSPSGPG